jgi:hypothetical protein
LAELRRKLTGGEDDDAAPAEAAPAQAEAATPSTPETPEAE